MPGFGGVGRGAVFGLHVGFGGATDGVGSYSRGGDSATTDRNHRSGQPLRSSSTFLQHGLQQNRLFSRSFNGWQQQQLFSQPQAFSQQAGLAQQAGFSQQAGLQQPQAFSQQAGLRSSRPASRSRRACAAGRLLAAGRLAAAGFAAAGLQQQAFSQQAGFSQQQQLLAAEHFLAAASLLAAGGLLQQAGFSQQAGLCSRPVPSSKPSPGRRSRTRSICLHSQGPSSREQVADGRVQQHFFSQQQPSRSRRAFAAGWFGAQHLLRVGNRRPGGLHAPQPPCSPTSCPWSSSRTPWLHRATLSRSAPNRILLFIEQPLLYNELGQLCLPHLQPQAGVSRSRVTPGWAGPPMGQNRLRRGSLARRREGGSTPAVRTVYCARAVEPFLGPINTRSGCLTRPRSVPTRHALFVKGQLPYRQPGKEALNVRKVFSAKALLLLRRKDFRAPKGSESLTAVRPPPLHPGNVFANRQTLRRLPTRLPHRGQAAALRKACARPVGGQVPASAPELALRPANRYGRTGHRADRRRSASNRASAASGCRPASRLSTNAKSVGYWSRQGVPTAGARAQLSLSCRNDAG